MWALGIVCWLGRAIIPGPPLVPGSHPLAAIGRGRASVPCLLADTAICRTSWTQAPPRRNTITRRRGDNNGMVQQKIVRVDEDGR